MCVICNFIFKLLLIYIGVILVIIMTDMTEFILDKEFKGVKNYFYTLFYKRSGEIMFFPIIHLSFLIVNIWNLISRIINFFNKN
mgnify:CR=1 FL=1